MNGPNLSTWDRAGGDNPEASPVGISLAQSAAKEMLRVMNDPTVKAELDRFGSQVDVRLLTGALEGLVEGTVQVGCSKLYDRVDQIANFLGRTLSLAEYRESDSQYQSEERACRPLYQSRVRADGSYMTADDINLDEHLTEVIEPGAGTIPYRIYKNDSYTTCGRGEYRQRILSSASVVLLEDLKKAMLSAVQGLSRAGVLTGGNPLSNA